MRGGVSLKDACEMDARPEVVPEDGEIVRDSRPKVSGRWRLCPGCLWQRCDGYCLAMETTMFRVVRSF